MKTAQPQAKTRLRDFTSHDIPPLVAILNQVCEALKPFLAAWTDFLITHLRLPRPA